MLVLIPLCTGIVHTLVETHLPYGAKREKVGKSRELHHSASVDTVIGPTKGHVTLVKALGYCTELRRAAHRTRPVCRGIDTICPASDFAMRDDRSAESFSRMDSLRH